MNISIAIPTSSLSDESTLEDKSRKISIIARMCSIFRIQEIYIYQDSSTENYDATFLPLILKYLETPQFFRKKIYSRTPSLKYAGVMHPLQIPTHHITSDEKKIKSGDLRPGLIVNLKGKKFLDMGIKKLLPYVGQHSVGTRLYIKMKSGYPKFSYFEISPSQTDEYLGYKVKEKKSLFSLLSSWNGIIVLTSRKGKNLSKKLVNWYSQKNLPLLIVFGGPEKGIHDFLGGKTHEIQNSKILNFFPKQGTLTVRLEEAIMGTLSIINQSRSGYL